MERNDKDVLKGAWKVTDEDVRRMLRRKKSEAKAIDTLSTRLRDQIQKLEDLLETQASN